MCLMYCIAVVIVLPLLCIAVVIVLPLLCIAFNKLI